MRASKPRITMWCAAPSSATPLPSAPHWHTGGTHDDLVARLVHAAQNRHDDDDRQRQQRDTATEQQRER